MSLVSKFGFVNTEKFSTNVTPNNLKIGDNYSLITDEPDECVITSTTTPLDQGETIHFQAKRIPTVASSQSNEHPAPLKETGIQYVVKIEELLSTTSTEDASFRVDTPIVAYLTVRHPVTGVVTDEIIDTVINRLIGACRNSDGTGWRFTKLMRSALKPEEL